MRKSVLIIRQEIITWLTRPWYLIASVAVPVIMLIVYSVVFAIQGSGQAVDILAQLTGDRDIGEVEGYVDYSGIIQRLPEDLLLGGLRAYPDEASARLALEAGEINTFYVIAEDYLQTGLLTCVRKDFDPLSVVGQVNQVDLLIRYNLLGWDELETLRLDGPAEVESIALSGGVMGDDDNPLNFSPSMLLGLVFSFLVVGQASFLMSSFDRENSNRVMEMLVMSVSPQQMLVGKMIGLGTLGIMQSILYYGLVLLAPGGRSYASAGSLGLNLPPVVFYWGILFFLFGFGLYASMYVGLGALVSNIKESTPLTTVLGVPAIITVFLADLPDDRLFTALSYFPMTSPVAMMMRIYTADAETWEILLALSLLGACLVILSRIAAGTLRAHTLLENQKFSWRLLFRAVIGKA